MTKIKEFDFGFENCEVMRFDNENIEIFALNGISHNIQWLRENWVKDYKVVKEVLIVLKPNANTSKHNSSFANFGYDKYPFDRIQHYDDITSIGVTYIDDDGTERQEEYYPKYSDADWNGEENECQLSVVTDKGYLILVISNDVKKNRDKVKGELQEDYFWLYNEPDDEDDDE